MCGLNPATRTSIRRFCLTTCRTSRTGRSSATQFASPGRSCINRRWIQYRGREISPGVECQTDEQLDEFVRNHAETAFHPCGTCKMGYDEMAVVDAEGRVHGLEGLRVVDASIMPQIITGNLNATTIMIGENGGYDSREGCVAEEHGKIFVANGMPVRAKK